jgi:hypothetical protein
VSSLKDELQYILDGFDELELLFKDSQLVRNIFHIPVLNEYRYFARALVDYEKAKNEIAQINAIN